MGWKTGLIGMGALTVMSGCAYTMVAKPVALDSVLTEKATTRSEAAVVLVVDSNFRNYTYTRQVYNWAFGNMAPDTAGIVLGPALTAGVKKVLERRFSSVIETDSAGFVTELSSDKERIMVKPEMIHGEFFPPSVRFTNIRAMLSMHYTIYDSQKNVLTSGTVDGEGKARLIATRKSYQAAMEHAIESLLENFDEEMGRVVRELP